MSNTLAIYAAIGFALLFLTHVKSCLDGLGECEKLGLFTPLPVYCYYD